MVRLIRAVGLVGIDMQLIFKRIFSDVVEKTVSCKEISIDICGHIVVDGEDRGFIDTSCHNYIHFDGEDFVANILIKEINDRRSL